MISHAYKTIFLHIPRTGGTSIEATFNQPKQSHEGSNHYIQTYGQEVWDYYFKFSIVRNPYDRLVSLFFFHNPDVNEYDKNLFNLWVHAALIGNTVSTREGYGILPFLTQCAWLVKDNQLLVDYVARFENYKEDLKILKDKLNFTQEIFHINKSNHHQYEFYYDNPTTLSMVNKHFSRDFEYFGYAKM